MKKVRFFLINIIIVYISLKELKNIKETLKKFEIEINNINQKLIDKNVIIEMQSQIQDSKIFY